MIPEICSAMTYSLFLVNFKMTVVEAYFGGKKMDPPDNVQVLSASISSLIVEGIAQNTSGSIFEPEVTLYFYSTSAFVCLCILLHSICPSCSNSCWCSPDHPNFVVM